VSEERPLVLIVDDEPSNIEILSEVLDEQHDIAFASGGEEAVEAAIQLAPDLILLDVLMPAPDGHEVCRRLQTEPATKGIPIIFVTALSDVEDEARGLELGAVDYVTKPISPPIVRARVRNHIELKRARDTLAKLAATDGLTGLGNRRSFEQGLHREWSRHLRSGNPLSLVLLDIDHFKAFNDRYGHLAGDDCLRAVARTLPLVVKRGTDVVARYGGEEFACLMPDTDAASAAALAEELRDAIAGLGIEHRASTVAPCVTASLGVASVDGEFDGDPTSLVAAADAALYRAKEAGRNRVAR